MNPELEQWLLDSDPALRWQVERDLLGAPAEVWQATRARVATEGCAAKVLSAQDPDGQWAGGAYFPPRDFDGDIIVSAPGQPWVATTWALKDLREWGLDPSLLAGTAEKLAAHSRWEYEDLPYWGGEIDVCINAFTLASGAWLGMDVAGLATWFRTHRLADGGWNCQAEEADSVRSSFHSTLNAVRGLLSYEQLTADESVREVRHDGEEYLLRRGLMRRLSTGEPVGEFVTDFIHPARWQYNALAALDHFREAAQVTEREPDPRLAEAVELVRAARQPDGTWLQGNTLPGAVWVVEDAPTGQPSKWLTLQAQRVLDWWDTAESER